MDSGTGFTVLPTTPTPVRGLRHRPRVRLRPTSMTSGARAAMGVLPDRPSASRCQCQLRAAGDASDQHVAHRSFEPRSRRPPEQGVGPYELGSPRTNEDGSGIRQITQALCDRDGAAPHAEAGRLPGWADQNLAALDAHVYG